MTISDIAKMAGVSSAAVSRYFNNGYISEDKKNAIRKVVEETGYHPSVQAQTLRTKKTKMIGVILPKINSSAMPRVVSGILSVTESAGYQIVLADTLNDPKKEIEYLEAFDDKQVDGVILVATIFSAAHKKRLAKMSVPLIIVGQRFDGMNCVCHDDQNAEYDLTKHMLENGCKNIGFIGVTKQDRAAGEERYKGFCRAVKEAGKPELMDNYVIGDFTMESGYEKTPELLREHPGLDGIICATDMIALGAMRYLKEQGISIPGQMQIAGHGDSDYTKITDPTLTTVHYYYEESGETAAKMLLDILSSGNSAMREMKLGYSIVKNESTGTNTGVK